MLVGKGEGGREGGREGGGREAVRRVSTGPREGGREGEGFSLSSSVCVSHEISESEVGEGKVIQLGGWTRGLDVAVLRRV